MVQNNECEKGDIKKNRVLLGRYVIRNFIGEGGGGAVYLAYDKGLEQEVVVKKLFFRQKDDWKNKEFLEVVKNEVNILMQVSDFYEVVSYKNFFQEDGEFYLVMEYIQGETLKTWIQNAKCNSPLKCIKMLEPIVKCISKLHRCRIIHRDICPDNIIVSNSQELKLIDFGAAIDLKKDNCSKVLETTYRNGYSPPEQYEKDNFQGEQLDIYAISAVLYFCLTKSKPPDALYRTDEELLFSNEVFCDIIGLRYVMMKSMALSCDERYKDIELLLRGLQNILR